MSVTPFALTPEGRFAQAHEKDGRHQRRCGQGEAMGDFEEHSGTLREVLLHGNLCHLSVLSCAEPVDCRMLIAVTYTHWIREHIKDVSEASGERLLEGFMDLVQKAGLELYPAQEEAILELFDGHHVILNTPTGSGKSMVALALHFQSLARGRRSVYTSPIKALVNEKFLDLCHRFGSSEVGLMTGDASVNRSAPILCCTAEILANMALRVGEDASVDDVIMDEFHYYSDNDRGVAWQIPVLTLRQSQFLLMSATMRQTDFFSQCLQNLTGQQARWVHGTDRPVPLEYAYAEDPLEQVVEQCLEENRAPVYIVHFTQLEAAENAQRFTSLQVADKPLKSRIAERIAEESFASPYGKELKKYLRHGIGIHHAGMLPRYRILIERMAQEGYLRLICGTDTLGVGVNVPIRTVLFTRLCKYDGQKVGLLTVRDFQQISGRAGRKGHDDRGWVICMAPEHVIENLKMERKASENPQKKRKWVKKQPPKKGFVHWDEATFQRLRQSEAEPLVSRFKVSNGMLLAVLSRQRNGCEAMKALIQDCHESSATKRALKRKSWQYFRSLLDRGIVKWEENPLQTERRVSVNIELQEDFSLNQGLALYLIDTLATLDPEDPAHCLVCISLVESMLVVTCPFCRCQLVIVIVQKVQAMKAEGVSYEDRMMELEQLEHPKPDADFMYHTYNQFAQTHPWLASENIRPKSIVREMVEDFLSFDDYVRRYQLQKSEGVLLRYLSEAYKVITQTIPETLLTEPLKDTTLFLELMIRQTDSSLLEEWERLKDGGLHDETPTLAQPKPPRPVSVWDPFISRKAFEILVRNQLFSLCRLLSFEQYEEASARICEWSEAVPTSWTPPVLEDRICAYLEEHELLRLDADARHAKWFKILEEDPRFWILHQTWLDPEEACDWGMIVRIHLEDSKRIGRPVMEVLSMGDQIEYHS